MNLKKEFIKSFTDAANTKQLGIHLQERDYKILRFILEQKFASPKNAPEWPDKKGAIGRERGGLLLLFVL